jgi:hypothetical protein
MAKPSEKSQIIDDLITETFGIDRKASIEADVCSWCGKPATEFKDELSKREYTIGGFCQECQDKTFKEDS